MNLSKRDLAVSMAIKIKRRKSNHTYNTIERIQKRFKKVLKYIMLILLVICLTTLNNLCYCETILRQII